MLKNCRNLDVTDGHMMHFETESSSPKTKSDTVVQKMNFESEPVVQKMNLSSQTHSRTPNTSFDPELSRGQPVGATSSLDNTDASVVKLLLQVPVNYILNTSLQLKKPTKNFHFCEQDSVYFKSGD